MWSLLDKDVKRQKEGGSSESKTGSLYKVPSWPLSSAGAKDAESGGKGRQIRRPFHPDCYILRSCRRNETRKGRCFMIAASPRPGDALAAYWWYCFAGFCKLISNSLPRNWCSALELERLHANLLHDILRSVRCSCQEVPIRQQGMPFRVREEYSSPRQSSSGRPSGPLRLVVCLHATTCLPGNALLRPILWAGSPYRFGLSSS